MTAAGGCMEPSQLGSHIPQLDFLAMRKDRRRPIIKPWYSGGCQIVSNRQTKSVVISKDRSLITGLYFPASRTRDVISRWNSTLTCLIGNQHPLRSTILVFGNLLASGSHVLKRFGFSCSVMDSFFALHYSLFISTSSSGRSNGLDQQWHG